MQSVKSKLALTLASVITITACAVQPATQTGTQAQPTPTPLGQEENVAQTVKAGDLKPPIVAKPCGDNCPYKGQTVTVIVNAAGEKGPISRSSLRNS